MMGLLLDKFRRDLALLNDALPSGKSWDGHEIRPGFDRQVAFAEAARPLALALSQLCHDFKDVALASVAQEARALSKHDKLLAKRMETNVLKLMAAFEKAVLEGEELGVGVDGLATWLDDLAREAVRED